MLEKIKKLKNPKVWIPVSAIIVIVIAALTYWLATSEDDITYMTEKARVGNISQVVEATGEVAAVNLVNVGAQVSGQIKKLYVVLGQEVKQGDMIAEIDSQTQENTLNTDRAKLANYKAQLEARKILLNIAKKQYDRELVLIKTNSTSQQNLENARDTYATARANVNEMESLIKQTQITINTDETNLGYTKIRAPLNGTIVSVPVEEGQTVNANQTTPTIVQIANLGDMEIDIQISEGDITKVKPGMPVDYTILSEPNTIFHAKLDSIDPGLTTLTDGSYSKSSTSSSSSSTSTAAVYYYGRSYVKNDEGKLRIGMMTQNTILVSSAENVLVVPTIALTNRNDQYFVRILTDKNKVEKRDVEIGISDGVYTEITSGLAEGDQVITSEVGKNEKVGSSSTRSRPPRI
ncbi:efflux RND transporter periplasmic adaptor subunit [Oxalobacter formigenes]|uniref:Efflux transporter, RND family, MFP subunit n=2 Tax=Oxalobacter TaxID=846 RepID=C3XCX6_OXAFO|nr:efflux RND transporter periplasmic adaptor subunit [Oxalobacter formigenes]ARQ47009.1 Macrolide export protein MacA [Oxalobacter formigenes]ARQ79345.1 efflux transporter periplasmic adaptor subunit [Oxalobacter formigenes OXCC13]EEO28985.1 efflux transporter, RND family, MFP subunit [Oxalobacter formigenes OXCC13]MCZ4063522.1 efflux RND transporter periplasmic adaptor subunit [Oxalobacter formigenes]QDX32367.1 efflux RND transporter periplasmic adaptor subunit [Oxalobacter formigenes]